MAAPAAAAPAAPAAAAAAAPVAAAPAAGTASSREALLETMVWHVVDLTKSGKRERALAELSRNRDQCPEVAPALWFAPGAMAAIVAELVSVYPLLSPPTLDGPASSRVCNALALLQSVASHPETRPLFLSAQYIYLLFPFLNVLGTTRPFEFLRLTALGVVGAFVKAEDPAVIAFLTQTEVVPLCLRIMEAGTELSRTVATFVIQRILADAGGLQYMCGTSERFFALATVLKGMLLDMTPQQQMPRLLRHILKCIVRLADHSLVRPPLRCTFVPMLVDEQRAIYPHLQVDAALVELIRETILAVERPDQPGDFAHALPGK